MIQSSTEISYKVHMIIGFWLGIAGDFFFNNWQNIALTFLLGFFGAMGAGVAKFLLDRLNRSIKKPK